MINNMELIRDLSSGANSHQSASLFKSDLMLDYTAGFELTYSDIKSVSLGLSIAAEFYDVSAVISTDMSHVFAVALASNLLDAFNKVIDANPIDIQSSTIIATSEVDSGFARMLSKTNLLVAPSIAPDAADILNQKGVRFIILNTNFADLKKFQTKSIFVTPFGIIEEEPNSKDLNKDTFKVESSTKPTVEQIEDAVFAWKIAKYLLSRGIVISKGFKTSAIIQGLQNSAIELALDYSCDGSKEAVLAVDGNISTHDLQVAAQGRIGTIILPSASDELIKLANKYNIVLISTGFTNYKG